MQPAKWLGLGSVLLCAPAGARDLGVRYCRAEPNSTGATATLAATGSEDVAANDVTLHGAALPPGSFAMLLVGAERAVLPGFAGGPGTLCLGGAIGRDLAHVVPTGNQGAVSIPFDIHAVPHPTQPFGVVRGDTLNFQLWFRDSASGGAPTSNLSDGLSIHFVPGEHIEGEVWPAGSLQCEPAVADVDADGILDLVMATTSGAQLGVLRGRPDRTYASLERYDAPGIGTRVRVCDVDSDGLLDVVYDVPASPQGGPDVRVVTQTATGGFGPARSLFGVPSTQHFEVLDFDDDGDPDVVRWPLGASSAFELMQNDGSGTFSSFAILSDPHFLNTSASADWAGVHATDLDADGDSDLVLHGYYWGGFGVALQGPQHAFAPPVWHVSVSPAMDRVIADFDSDGVLDIALVQSTLLGAVAVHVGRGDGTFRDEARYSVGQTPYSLSALDLDADGDLDLECIGYHPTQVVRLTNDGSARFAVTSAPFELGSPHGDWTWFADCDGDQREDLVSSFTSSATLEVLWQGVNGEFDTRQSLTFPLPEQSSLFGVVDLDRDGVLDLVSVVDNRFLFTRLDGNWGAPTSVTATLSGLGQLIGDVLVDDLQGDGTIEVAAVRWRNGLFQLDVHRITHGVVHAIPPPLTSASQLTLHPQAVDVDGDGLLDLLVQQIDPVTGAWIFCLRSDGQGGFLPPVVSALGTQGYSFSTFGDVTGDGVPDAVRSTAAPALEVTRGLGNGSFAGSTSSPIQVSAARIALADLDGDGDNDALSLTPPLQGWSVTVHKNDGQGAFPSSLPSFPAWFGAPPFLDYDQDGDLDLLLGDRLFENQGAGEDWIVRATVAPLFVAGLTADVDGDGDRDFLTLHSTPATVRVVRNLCR